MAANDVSLNNPAGRLHRILSRAKSAGQQHVLSAFASALEVPPTNIPEILDSRRLERRCLVMIENRPDISRELPLRNRQVASPAFEVNTVPRDF